MTSHIADKNITW